MKQPRKILLLVYLLLLVSLACNIPGRSTPVPVTPMPDVPKTEETKVAVDPTSTTQPDPTVTQPPSTTIPKSKTSTIEITNISGVDIAYIYIADADDDDWGDNWLDGDIIADGETYQLTGIPDGFYDMQANDIDDYVVHELWDVEVKGTYEWTIELAVSLEVYNLSTKTISELYIVSSDSDTWGDDWLAGDEIPVDDYYYFPELDSGLYDIKAVGTDGKVIETLYNFEINGPYYVDIIGKTLLPTNAILRFEDDFSDNRNSWGEDENEDVRYNAPANGEFCMDIKVNNLTAWEWYEPFRPDEFVAEVACQVSVSGTDSTCGLGFGPDGDNLYWFEVSAEYQTFALFLLLNDEWQDNLIPWTESLSIYPDGWNYLSLQRINGVVSVLINGVLAGEVESDHFPTGRIGIGGSTYDDGNVTVCLDDLRVWRME
ncbi:MAG: hypothetical protein P1S60_17770 [Anaerolineae bacterium]|nr:hypothetical protein [Anaerolineae bacterium]